MYQVDCLLSNPIKYSQIIIIFVYKSNSLQRNKCDMAEMADMAVQTITFGWTQRNKWWLGNICGSVPTP